jgi:hypothetical protein
MNRDRRRETPTSALQDASAVTGSLVLGKQTAKSNSISAPAAPNYQQLVADDDNRIVLDPQEPHLYYQGRRINLWESSASAAVWL